MNAATINTSATNNNNSFFRFPLGDLMTSLLFTRAKEIGVSKDLENKLTFFVPRASKVANVVFAEGLAKPMHFEGKNTNLALPDFWLEIEEVVKHTLAMFAWCVEHDLEVCTVMNGDLGPDLMRAAADETGTTTWIKNALVEGVAGGSEQAKRFLAAFE